jgi:hypothetical protein
VEKSCLVVVQRRSVAAAQGEAAETVLLADWISQSRLFGSKVHSVYVGVILPRPTLLFGYERPGSIKLASQLETEWDVSDGPKLAAKRTGAEPVEDAKANERTL